MRFGINSSDMLRRNRSLIVKHLMRVGSISRTDLAKMTALTQATITKIVADLIESGFVEETGLGKGEKGRRTINLRLCTQKFFVVGIKLTRRNIIVGVFDFSSALYEKHTLDIAKASPMETVASIETLISQLRQQYPSIVAIGLSVPGPYLRSKGVIAKMTEQSAWDSFNVKQYFNRERFGLPVFIEHDAKAGALAIHYYDEVTCDVLVHLLLSDGVGAGILVGDNLLLGRDGIAGEVGHTCIDINGRPCPCAPHSQGCLEQYCSSLSFLRDVKEALAGREDSTLYAQRERLSVEDVFEAASAGDAFAVHMTELVGSYIGIGIVNIINTYNPDCIIMSDIMTKGGPIMLRSIQNTVRERILPELYEHVRIKYCCLKEDPTLLGAMATVLDNFLLDPYQFSRQKKQRG